MSSSPSSVFSIREARLSGLVVTPTKQPKWRLDTKRRLHQGRLCHASVVVMGDDTNNKKTNSSNGILVVGGHGDARQLTSVELYNNETWSNCYYPPLTTQRSGHAAVHVNHHQQMVVYVIGGENDQEFLNTIEVLDLNSTTTTASAASTITTTNGNNDDDVKMKWKILPCKLRYRRSGCAAVYDSFTNCIYIMGGWNGQEKLSSCEIFNLTNQTMSIGPPLTTERWGCGATLIQNSLYVVGGMNAQDIKLDTMEVLNLDQKQNKKWTLCEECMSVERFFLGVTHVMNHLLVVVGGASTDQGDANFTLLDSVEAYDVNRKTWWNLPCLTTPRYGCSAVTTTTTLTDDDDDENDSCIQIVVTGGYYNEEELDTMEYMELIPNQKLKAGLVAPTTTTTTTTTTTNKSVTPTKVLKMPNANASATPMGATNHVAAAAAAVAVADTTTTTTTTTAVATVAAVAAAKTERERLETSETHVEMERKHRQEEEEEANNKLKAEKERREKEEKERLRREKEEQELLRREAAEKERVRLEGEKKCAEEERLSKEAEKKKAKEEKLRFEKEEKERIRREKEEQKRLRLEAEQAEKERLRREAAERAEEERLGREAKKKDKEEKIRLKKEENQRLLREKEEQERLQREAAELERVRLEAEQRAEEESLHLEAEKRAEEVRLRLKAEEEKLRLEKKENERLRLEKEEQERKRREEQERLRHEAQEKEEQERLRIQAEELAEKEKKRIEAAALAAARINAHREKRDNDKQAENAHRAVEETFEDERLQREREEADRQEKLLTEKEENAEQERLSRKKEEEERLRGEEEAQQAEREFPMEEEQEPKGRIQVKRRDSTRPPPKGKLSLKQMESNNNTESSSLNESEVIAGIDKRIADVEKELQKARTSSNPFGRKKRIGSLEASLSELRKNKEQRLEQQKLSVPPTKSLDEESKRSEQPTQSAQVIVQSVKANGFMFNRGFDAYPVPDWIVPSRKGRGVENAAMQLSNRSIPEMDKPPDDNADHQAVFNATEAALSGFPPISPGRVAEWIGDDSVALNHARWQHAAVKLDDHRILLVGGFGDADTPRLAEVYNDSTKTWEKWPELNEPRSGHAAILSNGKVYVMGGRARGGVLDSIECIDMESKPLQWETLGVKLSSKRSGCTAAAVGSLIVIIGGDNGTSRISSVEIFNVKTGNLRQGPSLTTARQGCAAAVVDDTVYCVGGVDASGKGLHTIESLSIEEGSIKTKTWKTCSATMSTVRALPAIAVVDQCLVIMGGANNDYIYLSSAEVFDTKRSVSWSLPDMSKARWGSAAVTLDSNKSSRVLIIGGLGAGAHETMELFDFAGVKAEDKPIAPVADPVQAARKEVEYSC